jgi:hypothetical protein
MAIKRATSELVEEIEEKINEPKVESRKGLNEML